MLCVPDKILEAKTWNMQIRQLEEGLINGLVQRCGHGNTGTQDLPQKAVKSLGLRKGDDDQNPDSKCPDVTQRGFRPKEAATLENP